MTNGKNNVKGDNVPSKDVDDLDLNKYVDVTGSAYVVHFCAGCRMHLWKWSKKKHVSHYAAAAAAVHD